MLATFVRDRQRASVVRSSISLLAHINPTIPTAQEVHSDMSNNQQQQQQKLPEGNAFQNGQAARRSGRIAYLANPYPKDSSPAEHEMWRKGWTGEDHAIRMHCNGD